MIHISCDVHTHTLFSRHAYSTVEEDVRAAADQGFELLGITDHFSDMLFEQQTLKNFQYFINTSIWPRVWHGVRLLHGCEADIVDLEGNLFGHDIAIDRQISGTKFSHPTTLKERVFADCDYVVASVHRKDFTEVATRAQNTRMYIKALEDPKVLILGHIGRSGVDFEFRPVIEAARDLHKLIEINEHSITGPTATYSQGRCVKIAELCAELGASVSFASDAHISTDIGRHLGTKEMLESIGFPQELIACRSAEAFLATMDAAGLAVPEF